ncbi:hypothetical protein A3K86_01555 [Photobacterium jeanii]|uniref:Uncharacterized protein n=2 Tax=Photobacterium jeanii TaxID=858640 RepID=A0A178KNH6_9GAMM|nr:hypothetical protein A3K86_01555 [Photobacterium jeanii]PST92829.1 hypothetical protein C9I91_05930 [Photobacterium jeanii]
MKSVDEKVQKLNAGWRKILVEQLNLDQETFKLAQGSLGLPTTDSSGLFQMADHIPPNTTLFDAGSTALFSDNYLGLLSALLPENGTDLRNELGDNYPNWIAYRNAFYKENPTSTKSQLEVFEVFANQRLDPRKAATAINVFEKAMSTPLNKAFEEYRDQNNYQTFTNDAGQSTRLPIYTPTIEEAKQQVNTGASVEINFDSSSAEASLSKTEIQGAASGFYDIFSGGAGANFTQLNQKAASAGFTIKGKINNYKMIPVNRGHWFNSSEYNRAYNNKDDMTVWDPQANAGNWDSFFAQPNGGLARNVSQILVVTDYEFTVTSEATYSESEFKQIQTQAKFGIWPFFSATATTNHVTSSSLNAQGKLETTFQLKKGLYEIWGVNVLNAPA